MHPKLFLKAVVCFFILVVLGFFPAMAFDEIKASLNGFNKYNDAQKGICYPQPQSEPCPWVLKNLVEDDKQNRFLGAMKSRYESCKKFISNEKKSVSNLQSMMEKEYADFGGYSNKTIRNCVNGKGITTDEVAKFYFYGHQLNKGASSLIKNQITLAKLLNKTAPDCPSELTLKKAADACVFQKKCPVKNTIKALAKTVADDEALYQKLSKEYKDKKKNCSANDCKVYLDRVAGALYQLNQKNPWFLNDAFLDGKNKTGTEQRLKNYFEKMHSAQKQLLANVDKTSSCLHGQQRCSIKEFRESVEKMPVFNSGFGKSYVKNYLNQVMESQQCIEEGALDRDRTAKILSDTSRDAALTVATVGLGSVPLLMKLGLTGRSLSTVRIGGEVLDLGVNSYFATVEWKHAVSSCKNNEMTSVNGQSEKTCNNETSLMFAQGSSNCAFDVSMALLASTPLGLQFMRSHKLPTLAKDSGKLDQSVLRNASLNDKERVAAFEKIMKVPAGTYSRDMKKYNAILKAHNMSGTVGNLNFSQIRERVSYLKKMGFTDKEIRAGLDNGIFGNVSQSVGDIAKNMASVDKSVGSFVNTDLAKGKVLQKITDTKFTSGQTLFKGENNSGIEIIEYQGKKVFAKIKFPPTDRNLSAEQLKILEDNFLNEVNYVKKLSDLNLGPKFHGVYKGADGKYRIVTDFVDGFEVHLGDLDEVSSKLTLAAANDISAKSKALLDAGIDPLDIQFRVDTHGKAHVIDPEYFGKLTSENKALAIRDLNADLEDLRHTVNSNKLTERSYSVSKNSPATAVTFNRTDDYLLAQETGKVIRGDKIPDVVNGKAQTFNYVLLSDGQMVLGKLDNEWQVGVNHRQLASDKAVVAMGELKVSDKNMISYSVGSKGIGGNTLDTVAGQKKVEQYLANQGKTAVNKVDHTAVMAPTRQPSFGELFSYCSNKSFRSRNTKLCVQIDNLSK